MNRKVLVPLLAVLLLALLTACGGGDGDADTSGGGGGPTPPDTTASTASTDTKASEINCSLSEIDLDQKVCTGPQRLGVEVIDVIGIKASVPTVTFTGRPDTATMEGYLTKVLNSIAAFWTDAYQQEGLTAGGQPATSSVKYHWISQAAFDSGQAPTSACGSDPAGLDALFYCPLDDTIYVSMPAIRADWTGTPLPGETSHRASGEWSAIMTLAHEYGHNIQEELGVDPRLAVLSTELEADCLAGVYLRGALNLTSASTRGGFLGVLDNVDYSGDYAFTDPQHHGTPDDRLIAVLEGLRSTSPKLCENKYE